MGVGALTNGRRIALVAAALLVCTSAAPAKDFSPGGLRVCGANRCVPIMNRKAVRAFSAFYYGARPVRVVPKPRIGAPAFEIRFQDGHVVGMVGGIRLNRASVYGLYCERFRRGRW